MKTTGNLPEIRSMLQKFQDGYTARDIGYSWLFIITVVLVKVEAGWLFHTLHGAMPVD